MKNNLHNQISPTFHRQLWKEVQASEQTKEFIDFVPKIQNKESVGDFLSIIHAKNLATQKNQLSNTNNESQVVSLYDIDYENNEKSFIEEKKYFLAVLLNAVKQIYGQIQENCYYLVKKMGKDFKDMKKMLKILQEQYQKELTKKDYRIKQLQIEIRQLKLKEQQKIRKQLEKNSASERELIATNKQLRKYLKDMNEILMSYHEKNKEMEQRIKYLENQLQKSSFEETQTFDNTNYTMDKKLRETMPNFKNSSNEALAFACYLNSPSTQGSTSQSNLRQTISRSPKSAGKRFCRKNASPELQEKFIPAISKKSQFEKKCQQFSQITGISSPKNDKFWRKDTSRSTLRSNGEKYQKKIQICQSLKFTTQCQGFKKGKLQQ